MDEGDRDLFGRPLAIPPRTRKAIEVAAEIMQEPPDRADYLHAVLCQVGMPRAATEEREFIRESGFVSMKLEAGSLYNGQRFVKQPLPYGSRPRLVMVHISSEAVRTQNRCVAIGESVRDFLETLGISPNGGPRGGYTMFKKQMEALAACRLSLGYTGRGKAVTLDAKPISRFEAWMHTEGGQRALWPGELELSPEFFGTLLEHAVPLDPRALGALKDSALALDLYSWLAHRLCRIGGGEAVKVSWRNLRDQFGQEYADPRDFKKEMRQALRRALAAYPDARVEEEPGGLLLKPSRPPLAKTQVLLRP